MSHWARVLLLLAGLMGMAGVMLAAAGRHSGGGDLAALAAQFLLIHAAVVLGIGLSVSAGVRPAWVWLAAATCITLGVICFAADLAIIAFTGARPFPIAAPVGGTLMIIGWFGVVAGAAAMIVVAGREN